jgi:hypothetical protein
MTSKARTGAATSIINAQDMQDPQRLLRIIVQLQGDADAAHRAISSNPTSTPCIRRGLTFAPGATVAIPHTLQRAYSEWTLSRVKGGWSLVEVAPTPAHPATQFLLLQNAGAATVICNVHISGD